MLEEFEKSTCAAVVKGLKSRLLTDKPTSTNVLTSLIICCYMKTFDNEATKNFLHSIKISCPESWPYQNNQKAPPHVKINTIMTEELLTPRNKPLMEILYGEAIIDENEVYYEQELENKLS